LNITIYIIKIIVIFIKKKEKEIQSDKLFTIDVYRLKKEKEFTNDYVKAMKQNYNINNVNIVLYNIDDVKENVVKGISKIIEKLRTKTGLQDFSFVPYNEQFYPKFYSVFDSFFVSMKKKIISEFQKINPRIFTTFKFGTLITI